jgi:hypothetical protein
VGNRSHALVPVIVIVAEIMTVVVEIMVVARPG